MRIKMTNSTSDNIESLPAKELYEAAISRSEHAPQSKIVSEFVLDALVNSSGESAQIRELRASIRKAIDEADDDKAHDLMSELKKIKDAEQQNASALSEISSKFSIAQILSSFRTDPAFEEIVYGLALKVLNQTDKALKEPASKTKTPRVKKEAEIFVITNEAGKSSIMPMRVGRGAANLSQDAEAFTLLGFAIEKDEEGKEVLSPSTFTDTTGTEHTASRKAIITAIESQIAFEGYTVAAQQ